MNFEKIGFGKARKLFAQFIKFGIVGVSNTLISLAVYYIFVFINKELYIVGSIAGFLISTINAYFWNNKFVFKSKDKVKENDSKRKIIKTYISYGFTLLLGTALLAFEVEVLEVNEKIAPVINLFITVPINFLLNKLWIYRDKKKKTEE